MDLNYLYDIEVAPEDIFSSMKVNICNNYLQGEFITIPKEYNSLRNEIFSIIHKISVKMGFKSQTYFLSLYYLDILFITNKKIECNPSILGLACLLLSAKYRENDPAVPELQYFIRFYNKIVGNKNSISVSDLFYAEVMTCKMLRYKLNYYTIYDFNSFFFGHGIFNNDKLNGIIIGNESKIEVDLYLNNEYSVLIKKVYEKIYKKSRNYLDKIMENFISYRYNPMLVSIYIMKKSVEISIDEECKNNMYDSAQKENIIKKANKCFNEIMKNIYKVDIDKINEYQKLKEEYILINIFKETKSKEFSPLTKSQYCNKSALEITPSKSVNNKKLNQKCKSYNSDFQNFNGNHNSNNANTNKNSSHMKNSSSNLFFNFSSNNKPKTKSSQRGLLSKRLNQNGLEKVIANTTTSFNSSNKLEDDYNYNTNIVSNNIVNNNIDNFNFTSNTNNKPKNVSTERQKGTSGINKLMFLYRFSTQNGFGKSNFNLIINEKKSNVCLTSPFKVESKKKDRKYNNYQAYSSYSYKKEPVLKVTKTMNDIETNYTSFNGPENNKSVIKDNYNQNSSKNINNISSSKPYYKKVVSNCGNKLRNFQQILENNNNNVNINNKNFDIANNKYERKKTFNRVDSNFSNTSKNYYISGNNDKKNYYFSDSKNNVSYEKKDKFYSNNNNNKDNNNSEFNIKFKNSLIRKKTFTGENGETPRKTLYVTKKNDEYTKTLTFSNNKLIDISKKLDTNNNTNIKNDKKLAVNSLTQSLEQNKLKSSLKNGNKMSFTLNIALKNFHMKNNNINSNNNNNNDENDQKKCDINNNGNSFYNNSNILSRTLATSFQKVYQKEKSKQNNQIESILSNDEKINNKSNNKFSNINNIRALTSSLYKNPLFVKQKTLQIKNNDITINNINSICSTAAKNNKDINLNLQLKKNPSTIFPNNNVKINLCEKNNNFGKKKKKNMIKHNLIQVNIGANNTNSLSYLLHKIPLCYNNATEKNTDITKIIFKNNIRKNNTLKH